MNKRKTGDAGEKKAIDFLANEGWEILETNYISRNGEIDIIAKQDNTIIFIEVKYRKNIKLGMPYESVNYYKQKKIIKSAFLYAQANNLLEKPKRFDVIEIIDEDIHWFKNAVILHYIQGYGLTLMVYQKMFLTLQFLKANDTVIKICLGSIFLVFISVHILYIKYILKETTS